MENQKNVELHLHTDAYWKGSGDAAETVVEAIDAAAKAGATSVAITDHGNCANWVDFFNYARGGEVDHQCLSKKGLPTVKPIMGCELYVGKEDSYYEGHSKKTGMHLIVLAKDYIGFQQISRAVSEANRNRDAGRPQLTLDLLRASFVDPGHVICMSACIAGPLANELLWNNRVEREIRKEEKKIKDREVELGEEYFQAKKIFDGVNQKINRLVEEKERLTPISKKTGFKRAVADAKKEEDESTREFMLSEIAREECETKEAKARIKEINDAIKDFKNFVPKKGISYKEAKKILTKAKNKLGTIEVCENRIAEMKENLRSEEECIKNATNVALLYKEIFGDDFFIELQYHGIPEEAYVMPILVDIAKNCGIRTTITNDVHILKGEVKALELNRNAAQLKGNWMRANAGDEELYYKTDDEKKEFLSQILPMDVIEESIQTTHEVAAVCNLDTLSQGKHYPKFKDADKKLRELAEFGSTVAETESGIHIQISDPRSGIAAKYGSLDEKKRARMERELDTISKMGFSSYFLFIADVILKCKTAREIATDIGPARGSGAGSIVCYLCGITELEPMGLNLLFERFLNPERVSMPKQHWAFHVNPTTQGC